MSRRAIVRYTGLAIIMVPAVVNSVAHDGKFVKTANKFKRNQGWHENVLSQAEIYSA